MGFVSWATCPADGTHSAVALSAAFRNTVTTTKPSRCLNHGLWQPERGCLLEDKNEPSADGVHDAE